MPYFTLPTDVYLVRGSARAALYDLRHGKLYSISEEVASFIESMEKEEIIECSLEESKKEFIQALQSGDLIEACDALKTLVDITTLRREFPMYFSWIEVTRQCNLSCTFCYEGSNPYCTERMSFDDFLLVVDNLVELGVTSIQFIGGEPLILKGLLKKMIEYARPKFKFIEVYTNGVSINKDWCEFFKKHKIHLALSIHSYIPDEHDRLTEVPGSHRKVIKALELVKTYEIPYRIGTVCSKDCKVGSPDESTSYQLKPKLPKVTGRADLESFDLSMFKSKAITKASKRFPLDKSRVVKALSGHQCFIKEIYISSLLDVFPCVMERRIAHGNLKKQRLKEMIDDKIRHLSKDHVEGCRECEYRYGCFDCRPDSNGNGFYSKPWHCSYDPTQGKWHDLEKMYHYLKGRNKLAAIPISVEK